MPRKWRNKQMESANKAFEDQMFALVDLLIKKDDPKLVGVILAKVKDNQIMDARASPQLAAYECKDITKFSQVDSNWMRSHLQLVFNATPLGQTPIPNFNAICRKNTGEVKRLWLLMNGFSETSKLPAGLHSGEGLMQLSEERRKRFPTRMAIIAKNIDSDNVVDKGKVGAYYLADIEGNECSDKNCVVVHRDTGAEAALPEGMKFEEGEYRWEKNIDLNGKLICKGMELLVHKQYFQGEDASWANEINDDWEKCQSVKINENWMVSPVKKASATPRARKTAK